METLKKEKIVERGMAVLNEDDSESSVRAKTMSFLKTQYSMLGPNDFDFVYQCNRMRPSIIKD